METKASDGGQAGRVLGGKARGSGQRMFGEGRESEEATERIREGCIHGKGNSWQGARPKDVSRATNAEALMASGIQPKYFTAKRAKTAKGHRISENPGDSTVQNFPDPLS
jgi:hypothetical protein